MQIDFFDILIYCWLNLFGSCKHSYTAWLQQFFIVCGQRRKLAATVTGNLCLSISLLAIKEYVMTMLVHSFIAWVCRMCVCVCVCVFVFGVVGDGSCEPLSYHLHKHMLLQIYLLARESIFGIRVSQMCVIILACMEANHIYTQVLMIHVWPHFSCWVGSLACMSSENCVNANDLHSRQEERDSCLTGYDECRQ
jgi:hypothetical protein